MRRIMAETTSNTGGVSEEYIDRILLDLQGAVEKNGLYLEQDFGKERCDFGVRRMTSYEAKKEPFGSVHIIARNWPYGVDEKLRNTNISVDIMGDPRLYDIESDLVKDVSNILKNSKLERRI